MTCWDTTYTEFVRENTPALLRAAHLLTGSASAAEDLVQGTLVRLYPQWGRVQNADAPVAYVRRTLKNQFLDGRRRVADHEVITDTVPERPAYGSAENDLVDRYDVRARLKTLGRRQCTVLVLRYYEGMSDAEIAETLGCRPGTVRSLISRGLATLRRSATRPEETSCNL
jgi:RNA polymerase sigma-70 factor (sigma-E family)